MDQSTSAEGIRKRPGMFIGSTHDGSGLAHLVWEVVANSVDEHLAGRCSRISVEIHHSSAITVEDDGRGMPVHLIDGVSLAERVLTSAHASPSFDGHAPHMHVGMHGVGLFPVCALSADLELSVHGGGRHWRQRFARGYAVSPLEDMGPTDRTGTRLTFLPDPTIFKGRALDGTVVLARLTELAFLNPKLSLEFADRRQYVLHQPRGLAGHLEDSAHYSAIAPTFTFADTIEDISIDVAARWAPDDHSSVLSFANVEQTTNGGTHVEGLTAGLTEGLKHAAPTVFGALTPKARATLLRRGLRALVCVRLDDPTYDSPTKSILSTPRVKAIVKAAVARPFADFLRQEQALLSRFEKLLPARH